MKVFIGPIVLAYPCRALRALLLLLRLRASPITLGAPCALLLRLLPPAAAPAAPAAAATAAAAPAAPAAFAAAYVCRQFVQACREVTGHPIPVEFVPARPEDPKALCVLLVLLAAAGSVMTDFVLAAPLFRLLCRCRRSLPPPPLP